MSLRHTGFDANNPMWLHAEVEQLELDRNCWAFCPKPCRNNGKSTVPSALLTRFDPGIRRPNLAPGASEVSISFSNMSFTHSKFLYRSIAAKARWN